MNAPTMTPDRVLELAVWKALGLIREGRPLAARLSLEVATYAADRIERDGT